MRRGRRVAFIAMAAIGQYLPVGRAPEQLLIPDLPHVRYSVAPVTHL